MPWAAPAATPLSLPLPSPRASEASGIAPARAEAVLRWLIPLRWLSAVGQVAAIEVARSGLVLPLPYGRLWLVPLVVAATNGLLEGLRRRRPAQAARLVVPTLVLDVALFTLLLAWSGGPDSPFSALYVVQIVLATMTGHRRATWVVALACAAFYGLVFIRSTPAHFWHAPLRPGSSIGLHALGMWIAVLVVAVVITFFMTRIIETLAERESTMRGLSEVAARNARLASLTTLAAGAAHELGSPLGTIAVIARELERASAAAPRGATPAEAAESLRTGLAEDAKLLRAEVERCRAILDRMRARAAHELHASESVLVAAELEAVLVEGLAAEDRARVRVRAAAPATTPIGPRFDVVEVIGPILRNALDASAPGEPVEVELAVAGGRLQACVRDRGTGMDAATLEHVGEPFFTTRAPGRGTGLGLFVVNLHLERLGGSLHFASTPGQGTTATVEWPLSPLAPTSLPTALPGVGREVV
ncbi:MAG: HAMP domain-containing sensor histidine kinase [Myxococcota bacterium]